MNKLDTCWKNCLSMWRWIAKQNKLGDKRGSWLLKSDWCEEYGFTNMKCDCFFCEYNKFGKRTFREGDSCNSCPAAEVDKDFGCCRHRKYHYGEHPIAFYNKIVSLNRKRIKEHK